MPLDYDRLMDMAPLETVQHLTRRDVLLYALAVGAGQDSVDESELPYVYEAELKALPTLAVVLAYPGFWTKDPKYGLTWWKSLHGEQSIILHRPLPVEGRLRGVTRIEAIYDKGAEKGALVRSVREITDADSGDPIATVRQSSLLRGDGGFGGRSDGAPKPHAVPERAPDAVVTLATRPEQALLYRLCGDDNPLHADPQVARQAGFARPILHGLCTYGFAGRAVAKGLLQERAERLHRLDVRFSSPVYPGETLETSLWDEGAGQGALRMRVVERDVVVLNNGYFGYGS